MLPLFALVFAVRFVKSFEGLPDGTLDNVMGYCNDPELGSWARVSPYWTKYCKDEMGKRKSIYDQRVAERAQLVNELEIFYERMERYLPPSETVLKHLKDASEEIEHYLNGFDTRLSCAMEMFHSFPEPGLWKAQIVEFAMKLAQHRATYPRPPPHRRGNQEDMPLFDAFIKMRDNNMEILQKKQISLMMFDRYYSGKHNVEQGAVERMMQLMEAIGSVIGYPGIHEMQQGGGFFVLNPVILQKARDLLSDTSTADIADWRYGTGTVAGYLSQNSCIGVDLTDEIMENVRKFIELE